MHNFVVHSNEGACRKRGCLGLEQVINTWPTVYSKDQLVSREGHRCVSEVDPLITPKFAEGGHVRCFSWNLGFGSHFSNSKISRAVLERMYASNSKKMFQSTLGDFILVVFLPDPLFSSQIPPSAAICHGYFGSVWFKWHPASATLCLKSPIVCSFGTSTIILGSTPSRGPHVHPPS